MTSCNIEILSRNYWRNSLWIVVAMALVALIVVQVYNLNYLILPVVVSSVFSLVTAFAYSFAWRLIALKHPDSLTAFYSAGSGFRFLLALVTIFAYYMAKGHTAMLPFMIVFMIAYLVMLAYHTMYFSKVTSTIESSETKVHSDK